MEIVSSDIVFVQVKNHHMYVFILIPGCSQCSYFGFGYATALLHMAVRAVLLGYPIRFDSILAVCTA